LRVIIHNIFIYNSYIIIRTTYETIPILSMANTTGHATRQRSNLMKRRALTWAVLLISGG
jgi:hypothetical protein